MKNITITKSNGATKTYEIDETNPYIKAAAEIREICKTHSCDVAQAVARYNAAHNMPVGTDAQTDFLRLINDALSSGDRELMTLDNLATLL